MNIFLLKKRPQMNTDTHRFVSRFFCLMDLRLSVLICG